jgi:hypothetical protein
MKIDPEKSVFINCPYDPEHAPLFDAIIFTTVCCGFTPRSALEFGPSEPRIHRILRILFESRYSIHDLSRNQGEGEDGYARFNMPLELGMAVARWYMTRGDSEQHDWLLLVPPGHHYHRFLSDLSGFDPAHYDGTVETLIPKVMAWLFRRLGLAYWRFPGQVLGEFRRFQLRKRELGVEWGEAVPWNLILEAAEENAPKR